LTPSLLSDVCLKFNIYHYKLWVEQFLRIDLHQKEKEENGTYLGKDWTSPEYFVILLNSID